MKIGPLKDKIQYTTVLNTDKASGGLRVFNILDVADAVEWLKSEIKKDSAFFPKGNLYLLIDEAFVDIMGVKKE